MCGCGDSQKPLLSAHALLRIRESCLGNFQLHGKGSRLGRGHVSQMQNVMGMGILCALLVCAALLVAVASGIVAGCNKSPVKLFPVTGKVLFKGQPAEGTQVVFHPASETENSADAAVKPKTPFGTVQADGSFKLYTDPYGDGAPPGDYVVMITWYAASPQNPEQVMNKLPPKYSDPNNPALKVTVKEGKNELEPFQLKS